MKEKTQTSSEPSWLDPRNDRKTPFTDAELDVLADDFIARMADTQAWQDLGAEGAVILLEKASGALEHVDSSLGAIGTAVNRAIETLVPIVAQAPASDNL